MFNLLTTLTGWINGIKTWFKNVDKKVLTIVILSAALAISLGGLFYVKKVDSNTIAAIRSLNASLESGNRELTKQLDSAIKRVTELEKASEGLNQELLRLGDANKDYIRRLGEISEANRQSQERLDSISKLAGKISSGSSSIDETLDRVIELVRAIQAASK